MKMKKIVLLFSMIAVLFSVTGCSDGQGTVEFEYDNTNIIYSTVTNAYELENISDAYRAYLADSEEEMAEILLTGVSNFDNAKSECGSFEGYRAKDGSSISFDLNKLNTQDETEYVEAQTELYNFLSLVDATIEEKGTNVVVTMTAVYEKRDVVYSFVYEENPAAAYSYQLTGQSVSTFQVKEITATPEYTLGEKMSKAAANTLMGMGTVFIVLIFISFIIAQFEKINKIGVAIGNWWANRKNKEEVAEPEVAVAAPVVVAPVVNPMDDTQLVAVITAAVTAANSAAGGSDKLIVRSIRKAKR